VQDNEIEFELNSNPRSVTPNEDRVKNKKLFVSFSQESKEYYPDSKDPVDQPLHKNDTF
jgi:hypothetical protein